MNSQTNTKQANGRPNKKTAVSAENISAMERNQNIDNGVPAISSPAASRKSLRVSNIRGRTGYNV